MGFFDRLFRRQQKRENLQATAKSFDLPYNPVSLYHIFPYIEKFDFSPQTLSDLVQLFTVDFVFAVVDYFAKCVRLVKPEVYDSEDQTKKRHDSHFYKLLTSPNPHIGFETFIEYWVISRLLVGNFYAEIRRDKEKAVALYPLQPHRVRIESRNGKLVYVYMPSVETSSSDVVLDPSDVLHIKTVNPSDDFYGFPTLLAGKRDVRLLRFVLEYIEEKFTRGSFIDGVLESDKVLPKEVIDRLKETWKQRYSGAKGAGSIPILEGGLKFKQVKSSIADERVLDVDQRLIEKILATFHVPPELLGLRQVRATALKEIRRQFWQDTMIPLLTEFEEALNTQAVKQKLLPRSEWNLVFRLNYDEVPALSEDALAIARMSAIGVSWGILTRNEARSLYGFPPIEGGDELLLPLNAIPVEAGRRPENEDTGRPSPEEALPPTKPRERRFVKKALLLDTQEEWFLLHSYCEDIFVDRFSEIFSNQRERIYSKLDGLIDIIKTESAIKTEARHYIEDVFIETEKEVLSTGLLICQRIYFDLLHEVPVDEFVFPKSLERSMRHWARLVIRWINDTTLDQLLDKLEQAIAEGHSPEYAVHSVFKKLTSFDGTRIKRIARTEATYVLNRLRLEVAKKAGFRYKIWQAILDSRVRESHTKLDNVKIKVDDVFDVGGEKAICPADISLSGEQRCNCRCFLMFK